MSSVRYNEQFLLRKNCLFYLFIQQQLRDRDVITTTTHQISPSFRLMEPISSIDDFGTWQYDHWRGLFELELVPHERNSRFPSRWRSVDDIRIFCSIYKPDTIRSVSSLRREDRPRTTSLDVFVHDVCARENNGQGTTWLEALRMEAILTYEHLANLRQSEWDNIQKLSMNAKKILKTTIDCERENLDHNRRQHTSEDSDEEDYDGGFSLPKSRSIIFEKNKSIQCSLSYRRILLFSFGIAC